MRNERKKRKRLQKKKERSKKTIANLRQAIIIEKYATEQKQQEVSRCRSMARSYWDRWQWELQKRKEIHQENIRISRRSLIPSDAVSCLQTHEIIPGNLSNPNINGEATKTYIEQGSFSLVCLQMYRGVFVAVKEFRPKTIAADVINEASILNKFCHPFLPYLFGVITKSRPFRIVTVSWDSVENCYTVSRALILTIHRWFKHLAWNLLSANGSSKIFTSRCFRLTMLSYLSITLNQHCLVLQI